MLKTYVIKEGSKITFESNALKEKAFNEVIRKFEGRRKTQGWKEDSKKAKEMQAEFILGAVAILDTLMGNEVETSISPRIFFGILRGTYLKAEE